MCISPNLSQNLKASRRHLTKGKGLDTCYSAAYMSQTRDQQRFTISEVAVPLPIIAYHCLSVINELVLKQMFF